MSVKAAYDKLWENINKWNDPTYFTDEQLETAIKLIAIDDAYGKEATSDFVHTVTYWWASATIEYYTNYVDNLKKVTREDIQRYVNTYIIGQPHVVGLMVNPAMKQMIDLEGLGFSSAE
jgi:zinc protease